MKALFWLREAICFDKFTNMQPVPKLHATVRPYTLMLFFWMSRGSFFFYMACLSIKIGLRSSHNLISLWLPATGFYLLTGANMELCWEAFRCHVLTKQLFSICWYWQSHSMEQRLHLNEVWITYYILTQSEIERKPSWLEEPFLFDVNSCCMTFSYQECSRTFT